MLNFIKKTRTLIHTTEPICIVIGNESCDLDSAVCALSLAHFYQEQQDAQQRDAYKTDPKQFLPVLNIPRRDYLLKTEVKFLFDSHDISAEDLTFCDELKPDLIARSDFVLVDHHVSPFAARCIEVFDHRPRDETALLPANCQLNLELVGSCATLVAELILNGVKKAADEEKYETAYTLLRSAIVMDTVNFSPTAGRRTAKDEQVCAALEQALNSSRNYQDRDALFQSLCTARADISALTPLMLLRKDLKILSNINNNTKIALPGFPLLVQHFMKKPDAEAAVRQFAQDVNCSVVLLLGMFVPQDNSVDVQRDIGLINIDRPDLCAAILDRLVKADNPSLCLQSRTVNNSLEGHFYQQNNIKATRKHILPLVNSVLQSRT